jgi:beta-xylosidase
VRVLQPISSADFEVEVKFDSIPHLQYQFEGILAQQDPANYLRLQFGSTGSAVTLSASKILSHTETAQFSSNLTLPSGTTSLWMRVQKAGSTWTISWSPDGTTYHTGGSFTQALTISDIGLFAGNYAVNPSSAPAFTALADYFHNVSATAPGPPVADSFNSGSLNTALWSFVNPVGDGSYSLNGSELLLVVPAGANHDPTFGGTDNSLRVVQTIANGDFGVVVKFDSIPTLQYQFEGLLVEQDSANFLRLQLGSNGSSLVFGASRIVSGTETSVFSNNITPATGTTSLWLKVVRSGSTWTVSWSADGTTFQSGPAFTQALTVSDIGPFAGNYKPTPSAAPAFTAKIDSFSTLSLD